MKQNLLAATVVFSLSLAGCASMKMADESAPSEFTYDYVIEGKSQKDLYKVARNFFAERYNSVDSVLRVSDEEDGMLYGKGISTWSLVGNICSTAHEFRFASKDGKARLQYELIRGVPATSACGWDWPTEAGYRSIVSGFNSFSEDLEDALEAGETKEGFMDF